MDTPGKPIEPDEPLQIVRFDDIHEFRPAVPPAPAAPGPSAPKLDPPAGQSIGPKGAPALGIRPPGPVEREALHRSTVLLALDSMAGWGQALAVIEVEQTAADQMVYLLQRWECPPVANESAEAYRRRSVREGEAFVLGYADPGDGTITYRLIPFEPHSLPRAA